MDRRSMLRSSSLLGLAALAPRGVAALTPPLRRESLKEAVDSGDPREVAIFIEDNPRLAGHAPLEVRLAALSLLEGPAARRYRERYIYEGEEEEQTPPPPAPNVMLGNPECTSHQLAAVGLLRQASKEDLLVIYDRMGGAPGVTAYMRAKIDRALEEQLERMTKLARENQQAG